MIVIQVLDNRPTQSCEVEPVRQLAVQWDLSESHRDESAAQRCLNVDLNCNGEVHATLLEALGEVYIEYGAYERAVSAFTEAVRLKSAIYQEPHVAVAQTRRRLASALRYEGKLNEAADEIARVIATVEDVLGASNVVYADALLERAVIHLLAHRLDQARTDAIRSAELFAAKGDVRRLHSMDVEARVVEVCAAEGAGTLTRAQEIYRTILEDPALDKHPWRATFLHNEGTILHALGDYKGAIARFDESIAEWSCDKSGYARPEQIDAHVNRGRAHRALKDFSAARRDVEKALLLDRSLRGSRHPFVAYDLVARARVLMEENRKENFELALRSLDEAIEIYRSSTGFENHGYLEAALRRRFELTEQAEDKAEADRIRAALQKSCGQAAPCGSQ